MRRNLQILDGSEFGGRHSLCLFRVYDDLDLGFHVGVKVHEHVVFTSIANRAFAHDDLGLLQPRTRLCYGVGDLALTDRAVELAFFTGE